MNLHPSLEEKMHELRPLGLRYLPAQLPTVEHNRRLLLRLCPDFRRQGIAGICAASQMVCAPCFCNLIRSCGRQCISFCLAHLLNSHEISDFPIKAATGVGVLENQLDDILRGNKYEQLAGELLVTAERELIQALTFWAGDLTTVILIREWMTQTFSNQPVDPVLVESTELADQVWRIFVTKQVLDFWQQMVSNGDAVVIVREDEHTRFLDLLERDPISLMETLFFPIPDVGTPIRGVYPARIYEAKKMLPVVEWCAHNSLKYYIHGYSHLEARDLVLANRRDMDELGSVSTSRRFEASYPLFHILFGVCRSLYFSNQFFRKVVQHYKDLSAYLPKELTDLITPYLWDKVVWQLADAEEYPKLISQLRSIPQELNSKLWPICVSGEPLLGSTLLFLFISCAYADLTASRNDVGNWFEDMVDRELEIRRIPVLDRKVKLPTPPGGDLDHVCYDDRALYLVEVKDYGPRSREGYFSSKEYASRSGELENYLEAFTCRLRWFKDNRKDYGVPAHLPIRGLYVTSYIEPHLKSQFPEVEILTIRDLANQFPGPPAEPKIFRWQYSPRDVVTYEHECPDERRYPYEEKQKMAEIAFVEEQLVKDFGSFEAFKVYKYAWEMCDARVKAKGKIQRGIGVGELAATEGRGVGIACTYWDVLYVTYHMELFAWEELKAAYEKLVQMGLLEVDISSNISIARNVRTRRYRLLDNKPKLANKYDEADIILYPRVHLRKGKIRISGLVDAEVRKQGTLHVVELKYF